MIRALAGNRWCAQVESFAESLTKRLLTKTWSGFKAIRGMVQYPKPGNKEELLPPLARRMEREKLPRPGPRKVDTHSAPCRDQSP